MIKNLAHFKKLMVVGRTYNVTRDSENNNIISNLGTIAVKENVAINTRRVCTLSRSNSFAGKIVDNNGVMSGNDSYMQYDKAKDWVFEGNKATWHDPDYPKYFVCFELEGDII